MKVFFVWLGLFALLVAALLVEGLITGERPRYIAFALSGVAITHWAELISGRKP